MNNTEKNIDCNTCGKIAIQSTTTDVKSLKDCKIIIDNVPCYICSECGEVMYFDDTVEQLEQMVNTLKNNLGSITYLDYNVALSKQELLLACNQSHEASNMFQYSITIQYDNTDKIYVANVPELEGCMAHGNTIEQATKEIQVAIRGWLKVAKDHGDIIPEPMLYATPGRLERNIKQSGISN